MVDAQTIERAFETGRPQPWPDTDDGMTRISALIRSGIGREIKPRRSDVCCDCRSSHPVEQDASGQWFVICEAGRRDISNDTLRQWKCDQHGVVLFVQQSLDIEETADVRLEDRFWYLGHTGLGAGDFPVWMVRDCFPGHVISSIQDMLDRRSPGERGIVIVSSETAAAVRWPRDSASVRLADVFAFVDGAWTVSMQPFHRHAPPGKAPKGRLGAPKKNPRDIVQMFRDRVTDGEALNSSLKDESEALHTLLVREVGKDKAQARGRIETIIRAPYGAWKIEGFPGPRKSTQ